MASSPSRTLSLTALTRSRFASAYAVSGCRVRVPGGGAKSVPNHYEPFVGAAIANGEEKLVISRAFFQSRKKPTGGGQAA